MEEDYSIREYQSMMQVIDNLNEYNLSAPIDLRYDLFDYDSIIKGNLSKTLRERGVFRLVARYGKIHVVVSNKEDLNRLRMLVEMGMM